MFADLWRHWGGFRRSEPSTARPSGTNRRRIFQPRVESLEARQMLAAMSCDHQPLPDTGQFHAALPDYFVRAGALSVPITLFRDPGTPGAVQYRWHLEGPALDNGHISNLRGGGQLATEGVRNVFFINVSDTTPGDRFNVVLDAIDANGNPVGTRQTVPVTALSRNALFPAVTYPSMVGRPVDPGGEDMFTSFLDKGGTHQQMIRVIAHSDEYRAKNIATFYYTYLQRAPDASGMKSWLDQAKHGLSLDQIERAIAGSPEFIQLHANPMHAKPSPFPPLNHDTVNRPSQNAPIIDASADASNQAFVTALYQTALNRQPDPAGVEYFDNLLAHHKSPTQVAGFLMSSNEFVQDEVGKLYQSYLCRDADPVGLNYWSDKILHGATIDEIVTGLVGSDEFLNMVAPQEPPLAAPSPTGNPTPPTGNPTPPAGNPTPPTGTQSPFVGTYTGTYIGTGTSQGITTTLSGPVALTVADNGAITVTVPGGGQGTVAENGQANFASAGGSGSAQGANFTFKGTFVRAADGSVSVNNGTWTAVTSLGGGGTGLGTWTASLPAKHS